uniref:Integrase catalytic domain-containing protein n=1 Tax=Amphimedon queenslandica TaxID=400682 RepID=A0A1X7URP5_AMPQE
MDPYLLRIVSMKWVEKSFKRFIAQRGLPWRVLSDNAKTFKRAAQLLREIVEHKDSSYYLAEYKIQWSFNIEKLPWWGGVFGRLICSVKRCHKKIVGRSRLTHEELLTVITDVVMIINSRPLSYITQDDLEEPIAPSHLLIGRRLISLSEQDLCCDEEEELHNCCQGECPFSVESLVNFGSLGRGNIS